MLDLRPVGYVLGLLTIVMGVAMLFPMALDLADGNRNWQAFAVSAAVAIALGGSVALASANFDLRQMSVREAFLLTTSTWVVLPMVGAIPLMLGEPDVSLTDAYFEAVSGMTTTGATVFPGLDDLPRGVNLWRGILQWLGGLGIVIVALLFLPVMRVGGMQFFRSEGFDTLGKVLPRTIDISRGLIQAYVVLTLACALTYGALGMTWYEATVHSLTTLSTGGFSTTDGSFATFAGPLEYAAVVFMILASVPFIRFIQFANGNRRALFRDVQVRAFLRWMAYAIVTLTLWQIVVLDYPVEPALRESTFNLVTIWSGTGYSSTDVTAWGSFAFGILFIAGLIGGCTASTGCSVKVFRYLVLKEALVSQLRLLVSPRTVTVPRLDGRPIERDVIDSVMTFTVLFFLTMGIVAVALSLTGMATQTAITAAWTSVANIGPAFGPEVGPTGAMNAFPTSAKWIMIFAMLIGRLELLAVFVLFTAAFWRG
ncbi:TrkH family potassium uptake protein [Roseicyclus marinus]|uniref:TrkH family potassium uptake protein n=1 Tax=Roseicyclus marinus TaxID=2161673 RepID=UPI0024108843|nr:TrkH family potassium uptake protein [Roseicyclus marinus]MDG3042388.1 TrkH family potassium uptake protein [Roseicyclus marinus]